jgi:acyl carrier protein
MNEQEGLGRVLETVASCLEVGLDEVAPDLRLVQDLGMDSLDFVDLVFLLERQFGVVLQGSELDALTRLDPSSPEVMQGDYLTETVLARARPWIPALNDVQDPTRVTPAELFGLVTVRSLWTVLSRMSEETA